MELTKKIEEALINYLPSQDCLEKNLVLSMEYSLTAGGKRIRPLLVLEFCKLCGGNINEAMPLACAVEILLYTTTYLVWIMIILDEVNRQIIRLMARI